MIEIGEIIVEICFYATGGYLNTQLRAEIIEHDMRLFEDVPWLIRAPREDDVGNASLAIALRHRNGLNR